ncbi:MAG TPA: M48 family metalloprotease [Candidatus Eremiobacteraeota bacterium]|nr:MAG: Metalloprotease LoiP precursor [bacterium ADurb.Bin363]HPZ06495.1 M48 family metalloprotease [Candidatus Eremiobacteraeota bacterium]
MKKAISKIILSIVIITLFLTTGCSYFELSTEEEIILGHQIALEVESYYDLYRDPETVERIQRIGRDLSRFTTRPFLYKFSVLDSEEVNAFALPGGHVYIFRGLLDMDLSDDQLAAIIGHEITHIEAQHFSQLYERMKRKEIFYTVAILATGGVAYRPIQILSYLDAYIFEPKYSRDNETECDLSSVQMLIQSGRNPHEFSELFKMWEKEKRDTLWFPGWMSSHPDFITRIGNINEEISLQSRLLQSDKSYINLLPRLSSSFEKEEIKEVPEEELEDYLAFDYNSEKLTVSWIGNPEDIKELECYGLNKKHHAISDERTDISPFTLALKEGKTIKYVIASVRYKNGDFWWDVVRVQ